MLSHSWPPDPFKMVSSKEAMADTRKPTRRVPMSASSRLGSLGPWGRGAEVMVILCYTPINRANRVATLPIDG